MGKKVSIQEADALTDYDILVPEYMPSHAELSNAYITDWLGPSDAQVALEYSDGTFIIFVPRPSAPNYDREVHATRHNSSRAAIEGLDAFVLDPGESVQSDGRRIPFKGLIRIWTMGEIEVMIQAPYPRSELVRIARSMFASSHA